MFSKGRLMLLIFVVLISAGAMVISTTMSGCSNEKAVDPAIEQTDNLRVGLPEQSTEGTVNTESAEIPDGSYSEDASMPDLTGFNPEDRFEYKNDEPGIITGNCSWWNSLGQGGRNYRIVLEALYSVDRQIWDQNERCTCRWRWYLQGRWGCYVPGDWNYSNRSNTPGYSGPCKLFAKEILRRASGNAATLPGGGIYDYRPWYPWRNRADGITHAQPGELMQMTGSRLHTAIIITNFHDGRFEVVDGNYCVSNRIAKHVINVNTGAERTADLKFYVIDCY